jgi:hypothetical protein
LKIMDTLRGNRVKVFAQDFLACVLKFCCDNG